MKFILNTITTALIAAALSSISFAHEGHEDAADATAVADTVAKPAYPVDVCIVSGEKLGGMGKPVSYDYKGREIQFCCKGCIKDFEKNPEKFTKRLDEMIVAKETVTYPLTTCVVSGEPLVHSEMGDPVDYIYNNHLVRFCCGNCVKDFASNPNKYLAQIDSARATMERKEVKTEEGN